MHPSQSQKADANQVTQVLVQYKACFFIFSKACCCVGVHFFPISFPQLIQRPCDVTESKYEPSMEILQSKKTS